MASKLHVAARTGGQRVQSGPLRHSKPTKGRYSPMMSRAAGTSSDARPSGKTKQSSAHSSGREGQFRYSEVKGDLFSCPASSSLAHCVSEDMAMGKGVAVLFKKRFGGVRELKDQGAKTGGLAVLERENRFIYYLVTKPRYFHKPTYETLRSSLLAMKAHCCCNGVKEVCLPRIGCGLDRLEWKQVSDMLREIFGDLDMSMTVYYL